MNENNKKEGKKGIAALLANDKYKNIIIIAGLVGIALIFLSGFFKNDNSSADAGTKEVVAEASMTAEQYVTKLEEDLTAMVASIQGAGEAKVLVTLENGSQFVYATEEKKNSETSEDKSNGETTRTKESGDSEIKYITVKDADGAEKALAVTEIQPTVKGVVIVCSGGEDPIVQQRIIDAVTTALNVSSKRVCVTRLS